MPKLKQPGSLETMAFDALLKCAVDCCVSLSVTGCSDTLRLAISGIKKDLFTLMAPRVLANFSSRFLDEFYSVDRPACHHKAALGIVMDVEIVGLRCKGPIVAFLDPQDGHRFRRLKELELNSLPATATINLENFCLDDLITFIFPINCTDLHLTVIGRNCPKLEVLKVRESKVTDEGLYALNPCSELCVVDVLRCLEVSDIGINHLLSVHDKLAELAYGNGWPEISSFETEEEVEEFHTRTAYLNFSVQCPAMNRLSIRSGNITDADQRSIVANFPNLTHLEIVDCCPDSLSVLKSLKHLTGLEFNFLSLGISDWLVGTLGALMANLTELLPSIGVNITTFKISCFHQDFFLENDGLTLILNSCPNIEFLKFDHKYGRLIVPPFKKLKQLTVCCVWKWVRYHGMEYERLPDSALQFVELLKLETLTFVKFQVSAEAVESMMLDDVRFPNLSMIETNGLTDDELVTLERNARIRNIDFQIKNKPAVYYSNKMVNNIVKFDVELYARCTFFSFLEISI